MSRLQVTSGTDASLRAKDPYELIAMIERAVQELQDDQARDTAAVDGGDRHDPAAPAVDADRGADEAGPVTRPDQVDDARRNPPSPGRGRGASASAPKRGGRHRGPAVGDAAPKAPRHTGLTIGAHDVEQRVRVVRGELDLSQLEQWFATLQRQPIGDDGATVKGTAVAARQVTAQSWMLEIRINADTHHGQTTYPLDFELSARAGRVRAQQLIIFDLNAGD